MGRLIEADEWKETLRVERAKYDYFGFDEIDDGIYKGLSIAIGKVDKAPTVDAVPVEVVEQLRWERDTAIQQLEEYGIPFCGKADVVAVVRCKYCRWGREACGNIECSVDRNLPPEYHGYGWFCPNGERRTDEAD